MGEWKVEHHPTINISVLYGWKYTVPHSQTPTNDKKFPLENPLNLKCFHKNIFLVKSLIFFWANYIYCVFILGNNYIYHVFFLEIMKSIYEFIIPAEDNLYISLKILTTKFKFANKNQINAVFSLNFMNKEIRNALSLLSITNVDSLSHLTKQKCFHQIHC